MKITLTNVNKSFDDHHILHDVSFTIHSGRAMGFLGRNGSGKTTTIRCMMDIFKPDSGQILIDGQKFNPKEHRIGYLPEERGMYAKERIIDQLIYFGQLRGGSKAESKKSAEDWLERFELLNHAGSKLEILSKGNQQKIQIIQAFINDPDIIILDEPFSGLDPVNSELFQEAIRDGIKKDKLIIFSSHQMAYVEEFCDDITLINQGRILVNDALDKVKAEMGRGKYRILSDNIGFSELKEILADLPYIESDQIFADRISLIFPLREENRNQLLQDLISRNVGIALFSTYQPALNDIFVTLVKENDQFLEGGNHVS